VIRVRWEQLRQAADDSRWLTGSADRMAWGAAFEGSDPDKGLASQSVCDRLRRALSGTG
jgi:hypothetical protein